MPCGHQTTGKERGSGECNCIISKRVAAAFKAKPCAVFCLLANAILTLTFLVLIIIWAVVRPSFIMPPQSSTCISCDKIKSNAYTTPGSEAAGQSAIKQGDDGMCCGPVESITQMLFQKEMAAQYHYSSSGQSHHKILWNKNGRTFYANNCIHLELEGELFIRQPGYYIVSSQLNLRRPNETDTPINETRPTTFIHNVDLLSHKYGTTGVLMQTKKSIERNGVYFTSFLSAVFKLNKYDRLSVSISQPELLDIDNLDDHFLVYYTYDLPF